MVHSSDLQYHQRSHCRDMTLLSWKETKSSGVLQAAEADLEFSSEHNLTFSLDRLQHARFRRSYLDIEVLQPCATQDQETFSLIISLLHENLRQDDLKQHIQTCTLGTVSDFLLKRSKTGRKKVTCVVKTHLPRNEAVKRLRQTKCQAGILDIEIANVKHQTTRLRGLKADTMVPNHDSFAQEKQLAISLTVSRLPESFRSDELKNHIEKYTLGSVLDLRIKRSKTGRMKATCAVDTDISKATVSKLLRETTFHGHRLDVEMVYSAMGATRESSKCTRSDPPYSGAHGLDREIVLFLSKLPNVNAALLKQHIRSHTGGRVMEVKIGPSTRGGIKALCVVQTHLDLKQALGRLQRARFQGRQLHVQILSRVAQGETLPSPQQVFGQGCLQSLKRHHWKTSSICILCLASADCPILRRLPRKSSTIAN